jgi:predicted ATPase/DNA-binding SARP family transcriptional activator
MSDWVLPALHTPAPDETASGLELRLFGPMEVRVGSHPLPRLRSRKGLWLLALLALRAGRDIERDWLAATLWPDDAESQARRSLRQSLHDLRLALGPEAWRLTGEAPRMLRLDVRGAFVDVLAFDAACARGDLDSLEAAVRQYRGPLLEDCAEAWSLEERRQREQTYLAALERLAAAAAARGEPAVAASYLRTAVGADPLREDLQRTLMEALVAGGNPADALLVYRQLRELLWREMAAEPAEETAALFRRLRETTRARARPSAPEPGTAGAGGASPAGGVPPPTLRMPASEDRIGETQEPPLSRPSSPHRVPEKRVEGSGAWLRLPAPLTALVGRDEAMREVIGRLASARLVTLIGAGGIGKTRLALQVAEELADEYEDGAVFVDLAPLADAGMVSEAVRAALGASEAPGVGTAGQETIEALRQYLAPRRLLLVLDNCEHLLSACAALTEALLSQCPRLRILATSRQPLGLRGETAWRVPSLSLPPSVDSSGLRVDSPATTGSSLPSTLMDYEAVRLFVERARAAEASFEMTPGNAQAIVQICRRLDGIPLAIELAAARVRSLSVEEIDARLRDGFGLLTGGGPALPRQQTLAATFDWSWNLLSPAEQTLLCRLSVFAGGWTLAAAEAICGEAVGNGIPSDLPTAHHPLPTDVLDLLTSLVDRSLVIYRPAIRGDRVTGGASGEARYHLLEPIRQYAAERLRRVPVERVGKRDDPEATLNRHRDYFLQWAEGIQESLWGDEQGLWFGRMEAEHDNLRAALEWCRSRGETEQELRLVVAMSRFWDTYGHLREGRARQDAALARMTPDLPHLLRVAALLHGGWMAGVIGDYPAARRYYGQALILSREHGENRRTAQALNYLALTLVEEGELSGARPLFEGALALYQEVGPAAVPASILTNLGSLALRQGDYEVAQEYLEQSVARCEAAGRIQEHGLALDGLSVIALRQARYEEARAHCARSLRLLHECGAVVNIPMVLAHMAVVAHSEAQWERVARLMGAAEGLREAAGVPLPPYTAADRGDAAAAARRALGADAFDAALAEGQAMTMEQAIGLALAE